MKRELEKCAYCGADATGRDHVPPKELIRSNNRVRLWKVNSCAACNQGFSSDEEYFRLMVVGALCHTTEADELFDGPISRSMDRRSTKEGLLFDSLGVDSGRPYIRFDSARLSRVAIKIARGLAAHEGLLLPRLDSRVTITEALGRGACAQWAPDFSFTHRDDKWELWFYDSVVFTVSCGRSR